MRRMLIAGGVLALAAGMFWVLSSGFGRNVREVPFMLRGKPAPAFSLASLSDGKTISLSDLRGKPVVMNFWASWCQPCAVEHPVLERAARQWSDRVHFIGMVFEDTQAEAREFLDRHGESFPQLFDPDSRVAVDYGVSGVPETYFITADGTIVDKHQGPIPPDVLRARVTDLLNRSTAARSEKR